VKLLHAYNLHRNGGGADTATLDTIAMLREAGLEVAEFSRDSRQIPMNLRGKASSALAPLWPGRSLEDFDRVLTEFKPDLVHVHELYPLIGAWIIPHCRGRGIPVVMTCYDYRMTCPVATHYRAGRICLDCIERGEISAVTNNCRGNRAESIAYAARSYVARKRRLFLEGVSRFIVLNDFSRSWFVEKLGIADERIDTIGCVVDASPDPVQPRHGEFIAYAGRFPPEKGVDVLVQAAAELDCPVKLIGYEENLPRLATANVEVVRTRSKDELHAMYRRAKALVMPSLWFETFGIVAAEAMSHGVPVVASNIGALKYTVRDGYNGLLFAVGDARDLAARVRSLLADPQMLDTLGANAWNTVRSEYAKDVVLGRLLRCYEAAIARG
jgi:glycosyltransferase involved in cell wall biosynthesis